ncbi:hypothetical protein [Kitasatospora sp. NPDC088346]|uniref:hypothetical protein n=1 Tax=Kitasatospora sp. NPDC088346 TaxID=3364073 RepID=UPI00381BA632
MGRPVAAIHRPCDARPTPLQAARPRRRALSRTGHVQLLVAPIFCAWAHRPGGTFYFSNIAAPNPYAALLTHIGRWNLVERTPADIEADVRAAAPPETVTGPDNTADATGLKLLATVRRALTSRGDPRSRRRVPP